MNPECDQGGRVDEDQISENEQGFAFGGTEGKSH
jgi:hypothetical protein